MSGRPLVILVAAAAAVAGAAAFARSRAPRPAAPEAPRVQPAPADESAAARPPDFPDVRDDQDRIVHWVRTLQTGADDDVEWAVARLRSTGAAGRRAVREAAEAAIESNAALVEQALDFLGSSPDAADADFARRALASRDPQSVVRAIRVLAAAETPLSERSSAAIGDAAVAADRAVRLAALRAFAASGDDAAAAQAIRVLGATPSGELALSVGSIEGARNRELLAWATGCCDAQADVQVRLAAASVLVAAGDVSRVAWLEQVAGTAPAGPLDLADAAVGVLAKAHHEGALARIGATAADRLAGADARITAIRRLLAYPADRTRAFLEAAAAPDETVDVGVTVEALDALTRGGDVASRALLARHVTTGGERAATAAALVYGRLRSTDGAPALEAAFARKDLEQPVRALALRALVLAGEPRSAETVVRAIAGDHGAYDAQISMAYNAGATLGDASPPMRAAIGVQIVRALRGEFGPLSGAGLVQALRSAGICCGPEAGPLLAERLGHPDAEVRTNAALALGHLAPPGAERDLKAAWWRWSDGPTRAAVEKAIERAHYGAAGAGR